MIPHTKLNDYRREVSHGNLKIPQADLAEMLTELWCWRNGGVTEELLRASDGGIRIGKGCRIVMDESCDVHQECASNAPHELPPTQTP